MKEVGEREKKGEEKRGMRKSGQRKSQVREKEVRPRVCAWFMQHVPYDPVVPTLYLF